MGQKLQNDKIGTLSQSSGIITMAATSSSPSYLSIGGQQYQVTASLSRTITTDVTLTAKNLYHIYAVVSGGVVDLRISANVNSVGPSGFTSWLLIGAFYSTSSSTFDNFINKTGRILTTQYSPGAGTHNVIPYTIRLKATVIGAGGGGSGAGSFSGGTAGTVGGGGNASNFGGIITAFAGGGAPFNGNNGGGGGSATITAPAYGQAIVGTTGGGGSFNVTYQDSGAGGFGGGSAFGGGGGGALGAGGNGTAGTNGGGGGGGGSNGGTNIIPGHGGGGAGVAVGYIDSPSTAYSYSVGNSTGGGAGGTNGSAGGNGGPGAITVEEMLPNLEQLKDL
jgi:hypothetical protein